MASGSITSGSSLRGRTYQINWSSEMNIAGNYSIITCDHYLINNPTFSLYIGSRNNTCAVDGAVVSYTSGSISTGGGTTTHLGRTQHTVWHNPDGSKQTTIKGVFNIQATLSGSYVGSITAEAVVGLDTIPRAAVPTLSKASVKMHDESVWINTNGLPDTFDYILRYGFGNARGVISDNAGNGVSWTPDLNLASQIPDNYKGSGCIECQTWSKDRSTLIGTTYVDIELVVPDWVVPQVSATYRDASPAFGMFNTLVQNVSKLVVESDITLAYGSSIRSTSITLGGSAYSGGAILQKGSLELTLTVTDNRGHSGEWKTEINVTEYNIPNVVLTAHRCNEDGTANDLGEHAQITVSGGITPLNDQNTLRLTVQHGYETKEAEFLPASWIVEAPSVETMSITATLSDKLCSTVRNMVLSTGYATMDLLAGGGGITFGDTATRKGFDCYMDAYFNKGLDIEQINCRGAAHFDKGLDTEHINCDGDAHFNQGLDSGHVNNLHVTALRFDSNTSVIVPVVGRGIALIGLASNYVGWCVYAVVNYDPNPTAISSVTRIAGDAEMSFTMDGNNLVIHSPSQWAYGWYIRNRT